MKIHHFKNEQVVPISSDAPNRINSSINVRDTGGKIVDVNVKLAIDHSYTSDLEIQLKAPDGTAVILVSRMGGSGDDFDETTFDDAAGLSINEGMHPFAVHSDLLNHSNDLTDSAPMAIGV